MSSIELKPDISELYKLNDFIHDIAPDDFHTDLIVEEIFVNIVNYSNTDFIIVNVDYADQLLTLEFVDNGIEFNPLLEEEYIAPESIEESQIGGLGIHITKQLAEDISYNYSDGKNHLKITVKVV